MANYRLRQTGQEVQDLLDKVEGIEIENGTIKVGEESITPVTEETDPTVPAWAKEPTKPSYSLAELQEDATHRTVTDAEKADWNGKQDAIADLDDIRSGAGAGATAVQPSQMQTALAGKQNTLVSGQNIKTINGESILGGGDIEIESGDEAVWGNISGTLADQTDLANALGAKYEKPSTGIPEADLAAAAREKLDKADTALQSESDPVFAASPARDITANNIASWNAKYTKPSGGIPASDIASGVIPDVSQFVTATVNNLVNYYLKSETYTRDEIQALIAAIPGMLFVPVNTLPTASAETANKIYIVPATNPQTQNQMDEFYTKVDGSSYTWEYFGSASIDLSNYVTTTALNTALADYTTTANLTTLLAGKQDTINDLATIRSGAAAGATAVQPAALTAGLATKQDTLESGVNIKTINGNSLLGGGNIVIQGGGGALPAGGTKGQTLVKQSAIDGDVTWVLQDENKELIIDQIFHFDKLQPTAYDSATGYYTVDSFPSWVTAENGGTFSACLNVVIFTAANTVPRPAGNSNNTCTLTKVDNTHFSISSGDAPAGTPNPAAFFFTPAVPAPIELPVVVGTKSRYRMIVENGCTMPSYYPFVTINGNSGSFYQGGVMPAGTRMLGYLTDSILQATWTYEFTLDLTDSTSYKIIAHQVNGESLGKSNATTFTKVVNPTVYGDESVVIWGYNGGAVVYVKGASATKPFLHEGTRLRVYRIG